jgi:hypothetical protein
LTASIACGGAGVVMIIAGTFLPWLSSGGHGRNIYEITGLADKLGLFDDGSWRVVPTVVPLLGPACILPVLLALIRLRRTAGTVAIALGLLAAGLAAATLVVGRGATAIGVYLQPLGPLVLLFGGVLLSAAGVLALVTRLPARPAVAEGAQRLARDV